MMLVVIVVVTIIVNVVDVVVGLIIHYTTIIAISIKHGIYTDPIQLINK